ncbi:MAG: hypothetical protein KJO48_01595, partial [Ignavibacteria bacterium]|nr:hypothetical protein [Ignavibacteria bacterium]
MKILLLAILLSLSTLFAQDPQYSLIDVSQGFAEAVAIDINNQGQVVGLGITNLELGFSLAFFWESGNTTIISPGTAIAINDSGWVLVANDQGDSLSLWKNGATISLNPIPSNTYLATLEYGLDEVITADVNNQNIVVASFVDLSGDPVLGYIWQNETWSLLPSPTGFDNHAATKINENNEISGFYWNSSEGIERPLYWQNNMPFSFSFHGYATSLNEDLTLVGGFDSPGQAGGGWKWENFILDTLFTLLPSYDINENSTVIGAGGELYQDGNIYDIESILDSTGNNYSPIYLIGINDADQIAAWANFNNSLRAALLSPKILQLTSPKAGELWIAGEKDTIKWISSQVETIEIELSLDNGNTYETFEILYPASNLQYVWDIPDTLLSRKCKIRITDESATTFSSESDSFKIKGYYLTRVTPAGDYEKFVPNEDGWQFGNSTANLWPPQWWQQFNYTGIDPITNKPYPFQFIGINNFTHPDWQLWVETFGTNQSYWSTILGLYIANSVKRWNSFRGIWGGSCYGFAASSFLGFNYKTEFLNKHPGISNYTNIFELSITDSIRKIINHYYTHQQSQSDANNWAANYNNPPITTLNQIKQMFLSEDTNIRTISLINQQPGGGGHTVAPFKVEEYSNVPGRYRIYVYDSNAPSSDTSFIVVDSTLNTWVDSLGLGWAGQIGLFLEQPITNYLSTPVLPGGDNPIASVRGGSLIEFYAEYNSEYLITNTLGESVGFLQDSVIFDLNEGFPVIPKTGMPHPPIGYYIP